MYDLTQPPLSTRAIARRCGILRGERPVSATTVTRWITRGLFVEGKGRVKLGAFKVGRALCCTEQHLQEFLAAINAPTDAAPAPAAKNKLPTGPNATRRLDQLGVGV